MKKSDLIKLNERLVSDVKKRYGNELEEKKYNEPTRDFRTQLDYFNVVAILTIQAVIDNNTSFKVDSDAIETIFNRIEKSILQ